MKRHYMLFGTAFAGLPDVPFAMDYWCHPRLRVEYFIFAKKLSRFGQQMST